MLDYIRKALTWLGVLGSRPIAFFIVVLYGAAWGVFSPESLNWHGVVALFTWMMTVLIQRAEHRDTQAIHAKLDQLLTAVNQADATLSEVDKMQPEEIEKLREDTNTA
jgi:low affinity Fe/Cu permease